MENWITKNLKTELAKNHILQKEVAEALGITEGGLTYKFRSGFFSVDDLCKISGVLGCELEISFKYTRKNTNPAGKADENADSTELEEDVSSIYTYNPMLVEYEQIAQ